MNSFIRAGLGLGLALVAFVAQAQPSPDQPNAEAGKPAGVGKPEVLVREAADQLLKEIRQNTAKYEKDPEALYGLIDQRILPLIDVQAFSQLVLGKHWREAKPAQREAFIQALKTTLIRTYSKALVDYASVDIQYLPVRGEADKNQTVPTQIVYARGKPPVSVDYKLRLHDDQWKVYDVVIDGLSVVKNFRTSFGKEIDKNGLDALIQRLQNQDDDAPAS